MVKETPAREPQRGNQGQLRVDVSQFGRQALLMPCFVIHQLEKALVFEERWFQLAGTATWWAGRNRMPT